MSNTLIKDDLTTKERYVFRDILKAEYLFGSLFYNNRFWPTENYVQTDLPNIDIPHTGSSVLRFITNSQKIAIKYSIVNRTNGNFPHIGLTAQIGISILYRKLSDTQWYMIDCTNPRTDYDLFEINMDRFFKPEIPQEIMICLPILADVKQFEVGILPDSSFSTVSKDNMKRILCLGGLHTFGVGCTSTAMMFTNILARKKNAICYNISFNSLSYLSWIKKYLENICSFNSVNYVIFEADYIRLNNDEFFKNFPIILEKISHLNCPIYLWSVTEEKLKSVANKLKSFDCLERIFLIDTDTPLRKSEDMCLYSNNFINDAGNIMLYNIFSKRI